MRYLLPYAIMLSGGYLLIFRFYSSDLNNSLSHNFNRPIFIIPNLIKKNTFAKYFYWANVEIFNELFLTDRRGGLVLTSNFLLGN